METQRISLDKLLPNTGQIQGLPSNPRTWTKQEVRKIAKSLKETPELFEARPIIVYPHGDGFVILGGNLRYEGCRENKTKDAPCVVIPEGTPIEKLKEIVIKDNGSFGSWDFDELANEWDDLPLGDWGVPAWDVREVIEEKEVEEDGYDEEQEEESRVRPGEIWQLGDHRVMCGDSTDRDSVKKLMGGGEVKADMVFTDPPYGVSYVGINNPNGKEWEMIENDDLRGDSLYQFLLHAFQNLAENLKPDGAFYVWFASSNHIEFETAIRESGLRVKQELIWDKGMVLGHSDYHWAYEPCLYGTHQDNNCLWYGDRTQKTFLAMNRTEIRELKKEELVDILLNLHDGKSCWRIDRDNAREYIHPTQKPIALAGRGLKNSSCAGQVVLDLFAGSGSTLMAAEQLGRKAMVMEFDPKYCDKILARWEKYTGKQAIKLPMEK